jgi:hypothetical protein
VAFAALGFFFAVALPVLGFFGAVAFLGELALFAGRAFGAALGFALTFFGGALARAVFLGALAAALFARAFVARALGFGFAAADLRAFDALVFLAAIVLASIQESRGAVRDRAPC